MRDAFDNVMDGKLKMLTLMVSIILSDEDLKRPTLTAAMAERELLAIHNGPQTDTH